jgi:hypothetical protein
MFHPKPPGFSVLEIREAFLRFFVALLLDYRQFMGEKSFEADQFLENLALNPPSTDFVRYMLRTQLFARFIEDRRNNFDDHEVRFFDESINAKIKRSKKTVLTNIGGTAVSLTTSFLDDRSNEVSIVQWA